MTEPLKGQAVRVTVNNAEPVGVFFGFVTEVYETGCNIKPVDSAVMSFIGGDGIYSLGKAHWESSLHIFENQNIWKTRLIRMGLAGWACGMCGRRDYVLSLAPHEVNKRRAQCAKCNYVDITRIW